MHGVSLWMPPSLATINGRTSKVWFMYEQHFSGVILWCQNRKIPSISFFLLKGLTTLAMKCFSSLHTHSIGLKSALLAGVFHQLISFWAKNSLATRLVCFGSLSCMKQYWPAGTFSIRKGKWNSSKMLTYSGPSILWSNMQMRVHLF